MSDPVVPEARVPAPRSTGRALWAAARPRQWVKNVLVFAAPGAAGIIDQPKPLLQSMAAFVCFCLAASGTYFLNDAADVESDRTHPVKRHRPIARGEIALGPARLIGVTLILVAVAAAVAVDLQLGIVVGFYVALTTAYSLWLKHVAVVDVVAVAAGFVLRAIAGGAAVDVPISDWFLIVASFGSLFMVVGKRRGEADELGEDAAAFRSTLGTYSDRFLVQLQTIATTIVLVGYCLWAFEKADASATSVPWFEASIVPFALAVLRYALIIDSGQGGAPDEVVVRDRTLQVLGLCWAVVFAVGVYTS